MRSIGGSCKLPLSGGIYLPTSAPQSSARFGIEAMKFVNSGPAKQLCLRGVNARVVHPGVVSAGDVIRKR